MMRSRSSVAGHIECVESRVLLSVSGPGLVSWALPALVVEGFSDADSPVVSSSGGSPIVAAPPKTDGIAAPTGLAATAANPSRVDLVWKATDKVSGFNVLRSGDNITFRKIGSSSSASYADTSASGGNTYFYRVQAFKGKTTSEDSNTATVTTPVPEPAPVPVPSPEPQPAPAPTPAPEPVLPQFTDVPVDIATRFGSELVITGTSGNDSIEVYQSGATLTIVANGSSYTCAAPAAGLFVYSNLGQDVITIDASTTVRTTVVTIDGSATSVTAWGSNVSTWIDSTDTFVGSGGVYRVASYANGASKEIGVNIADPTDTGSIKRYVNSLWGIKPVSGDVSQGSVGDCYLLASLAGFAHSSPAKLMEMAVDLGDGTYAVKFVRSGVQQYVRVDADFAAGGWSGFAYAHPGASGASWAMVIEKAYAFFRSGKNTYASLSSGWMSAVFNDLGVAPAGLSVGSNQQTFYNTVSAKLAGGKAVTLGTGSSVPNLVGGHAYTIISASIDVAGNTTYVVRNPWGFAGTGYEAAGGLATLTFAQMQSNFTLSGVMAA